MVTERETDLTDAEVVRRVRHGDRDVYRVLVERYQDTLFRYALSMVRERDIALDLVQATFVNAFTQLSKLRDGTSFGGWAYRMCMNRCRDHLKSRRRRDVSLDDVAPHALASPARADAPLESDELRRSLDDAMASLSDELREAFVLKHIEGRSYEEMARLQGRSVGALKMRVHRAREALKNALEEVL